MPTDLSDICVQDVMEPDFWWIYLVFLAIPLARIIPRLISRRNKTDQSQTLEKQPGTFEEQPEQLEKYTESKPQTKNMLVLGALNRGSRSFESIQKNTGIESQELETILGKLEEKGLLVVKQKQGVFGTKIQLFPTDKGFKEYYS